MKVIWGAEDIKPGRRYSKHGIEETWMIGYISAVDGPVRYVSVSDQDGMVTEPSTKEDLARSLTEHDYLPMELLD